MKKRSLIIIFALVLLLVVAVSPTLAHDRHIRVAGEITAVDTAAGQFTLDLRFGDPIAVQTSTETEFFRKIKDNGLEPIALGDLLVEDRVQVTGARGDEALQAKKVVVMPSDAKPPAGVRGPISELGDDGVLMVERREGDAILVQTTEQTKFYRAARHGRLQQITFDDLEIGDWIKSRGEWDGDMFTASHVLVRARVHRP